VNILQALHTESGDTGYAAFAAVQTRETLSSKAAINKENRLPPDKRIRQKTAVGGSGIRGIQRSNLCGLIPLQRKLLSLEVSCRFRHLIKSDMPLI
jgi:hypothetical protein